MILKNWQAFIIPAIDIIDGKCVRLSEGDFNTKKVYNDNPLEVAKAFEEKGFKRLHIVDLDGAKNRKLTNIYVLEAIAKNTSLIIDFGGGISSNLDVKQVLNAGATQVNIGSIAVKQPIVFSEWLNEFGAESFLLGADVKNEKLAINGWKEQTEISIYNFIKDYQQKNVNQFFCTDISKDGMLQGPAIELYKNILETFPNIKLIASGGVSCLNDLILLQQLGCSATIVGKAIYEGRINLNELN